MNISNITAFSQASGTLSAASQKNEVAAEFETMFYRTLLQGAQWMSGVSGVTRSDQSIFAGMFSDFFAEEAARQQAGFGALLINEMKVQGETAK